MAGSAWDNLNLVERELLDDYPNVQAFFEQMPHRENDPAGLKLREALKDTVMGIPCVNENFATRLNSGLANPEVRAGIVALPPEVIAEHVDKVIARPEETPAILADVQAATATPAGKAEPVEAVAAATTAAPEVGTEKAPAPPADKPEPIEAVAAATTAAPEAEAATPTPEASGIASMGNDPRMAAIAGAEGFRGFLERIGKNPDLRQAFESFTGGGGGEKMDGFVDGIHQRVQKDPQFFNKVNKMMDSAPEQMLSTMARDMTNDPAGALQKLDMANMFSGFMDSPFGQGLSVVGSHLMGILGPLMEILQGILGKLPEMLEGLGNKISGLMEGFSAKTRAVVTNHPDGATPMTDALDQVNGKKPETTAYDAKGQEITPTTTPKPADQRPEGPQTTQQQTHNDPNNPNPSLAGGPTH